MDAVITMSGRAGAQRALKSLEQKPPHFIAIGQKPADFRQFKSACQQLQHSINSVSREGQLINVA